MKLDGYTIVNTIINETDLSNMSSEEKDKRKRMLRRLAVGGVALGSAVTAGELMLHPSSRADIIKAASQKGTGKKIAGIGKQIWKPMALGAGAELAVEPLNVKIAQHLEDKYQKKEKNKSKN